MKAPTPVPIWPLLAALATVGCGGAAVEASNSPSAAPTATKAESEAREEPHPAPTPAIELRFPRAATPWLGVELRATESPQAGVEITRVMSGSPAARAGLEAGDILVTLGETPVVEPVEVANWVMKQGDGTEHPLSVLREGKARLLRVVLEGRPEFEDRLRLELVGKPAPEIAGVATFQGEASSLGELRGKVVVLEFWASYCGVCRFLAPRLDDWHRTYKPQGAEVVGITVDPPNLGRRVAERTGMSYTLASDPQAKVTHKYMASQIPVVVIIDRNGIVQDAMVGYSERRIVETKALIERLIDQES